MSSFKSKTDKICNICGSNKFDEEIVICTGCRRASQHIYCMHRQLDSVPLEWYCEQCTGGSKQPIGTTQGLGSVRTSQGQGPSSGQGNISSRASQNQTASDSFQPTGPGEGNIGSRASQNQTALDSFQPIGPGPNAEMIDLPGPYIVLRDDKPYPPVNDVCWRGEFEVNDIIPQIFTGIRGHTPGKLHRKAYDMLKVLPKTLKLREHRRLDLWPKSFESNPPTLRDIGIYFFRKELPEYKDTYGNFLKRLDRMDRALGCIQGGIQFLIFTSTYLDVYSQAALKSEHKNNIFLWGLFRHVKPKEERIEHEEQTPHTIDTAVIAAAECLMHLQSDGKWKVQMADSKIHYEPKSNPEMPPGFGESIHGKPPACYPQKRKKLN